VGHQGRIRPVFDGAMGALSRAVPARFCGLDSADRVGTAHAIERVAIPSVVRRAPIARRRRA
jgi:hypothetical protein